MTPEPTPIDGATRYRVSEATQVGFDPVHARPTLLSGDPPWPLSEVGYQVTLQCDGSQTVAEMLEALTSRFSHLSEKQVAREMLATLEVLHERNLLEPIE